MALVFIPALLRHLTGGKGEVDAPGATVRQVIDHLDQIYPGIRDAFVDGSRLRSNLSVAVDGEVSSKGLLEKVSESSEVHFLPAVRGG